jgi:type IV fimbrial biogenesis protein FimT
MRASRGVTLVELLAALAVTAVLMGVALPAMHGLLARHRVTATLNHLIGGVQLARHAAISLRTPVSFCPSDDALQCGVRDTWHAGALVFLDRNRNGTRDEGDTLLRVLPSIPAAGRITWRSFRNRSYLTFEPRGFTRWQNGTFRFCPADADPALIRAIIVNPQGRVRQAPDADGDGVVEDANGRPMACP